MGRNRLIQRLLPLLLALPLASTMTLAYTGYTGISPLNRVLGLISSMFNLPILQNPTVQQGFIRFCLFVIFLAVSHWVFAKLFDNKTSAVISTAFSLMAAFLMPINWVSANGSVITAIFSMLIPLGLVGGGIYVSYKYLNGDAFQRLMAIVLLLLLLAILDVYRRYLGLPIILLVSTAWLRGKR